MCGLRGESYNRDMARFIFSLAVAAFAAQAVVQSPVEPYKRDGKFGLRDEASKKEITPPLYDHVGHCYEGRCGFQSGGHMGFLDEAGKAAIPATFEVPHVMEFGGYFKEGFSGAKSGGVWGYIDRSGVWKLPPKFNKVNPFSEGLAAVDFTEPGKPAPGRVAADNPFAKYLNAWSGNWGFIDPSGAVKISAQFEEVKDFSKGRAYVKKEGKWGVLAKDGSWFVPPRFDEAPDFLREGLILVKQDGKVGFVDKDFKIVVAPTFEGGQTFHQGLAAVKTGGLWGYIGVKGEFVIAPRFQYASTFDGESAGVRIEDGYSLIDRNGKELCSQRYKDLADFRLADKSGRVPVETLSGDLGRIDRACRWFADGKP